MARQIVVDIIGDSSKFGSAIDKATGKTSGFTNILKGAGMGIGLGMFSLATSAIGGVTDALGQANQAYQEDMASQAKLKTALSNTITGWDGNTKAIEDVISAQMRLGFGDEEQRDSLALLVGSTNDVVKAQELQVAAMDLARLKGIDLASATDIMLKANEGNYRGLKSVGITLDANTTSTEMLAEVTKLAGGQAEAYANGPLGKQEAAQLKVGESMERIGSIVNSVASVALPILADAFTGIVDVIMEVWEGLQPLIDTLARELGPAFKAIGGFISGTLFPVFKTLVGVHLKVLSTAVSTLAGVVLPPLRAILGVLGTTVVPVLGKAFQFISGTVIPALTKGFNWLRQNVLVPLQNGLKLLGDGARNLGNIFAALSSKVRVAWNAILGAVRSVINAIIRGWNSLRFEVPSVDLGPLGRIGGFSIGTPNIPLMHKGGIVPGPRGADVPIMAQAGEMVTPMNDVGRGNITIVIEQFYGSDRDIDKFTDRLALRLMTTPG